MFTPMSGRLVTASVSLLLGLTAGCTATTAPTADHFPQSDPPRVEAPHAGNPIELHDDASIARRVRAAVLGVPGIHDTSVLVSAEAGVVSLRATASDEVSARNAVQAARQVTGVRTVDYDLAVEPLQHDGKNK